MLPKKTKFGSFGTHRSRKYHTMTHRDAVNATYRVLERIEHSIVQGRITEEDDIIRVVEKCIKLLNGNIEELIATMKTKDGCGEAHQYGDAVYTGNRMAVCYVHNYSRTCETCGYVDSFSDVQDWFIENHPDDDDYEEVENVRKKEPKPVWCDGAKYYETHEHWW